MTLAQNLASTDSHIIKEVLFSLLNDITSPGVIALDQEYQALQTEKEKHAFLAAFEVSARGDAPQRSPALLERWTHYRWMRLELMYLINQKAALNQIKMLKEQTQEDGFQKEKLQDFNLSLNPSEIKAFNEMKFKDFQTSISEPAFDQSAEMIPEIESIGRAIKKGAEQGLSIEDSIKVLSKMTLQIVGTEHPTDPLSQEARDTLAKIANAMAKKNPQEDELKALLSDLVRADAIPYSKRTVVEEVNRNIHITLSPLYDNVPHLVRAILEAYLLHYGEEAYLLHRSAILRAIEGGQEVDGVITSPLLRDASWPAYDADGNVEATPAAMGLGLRLQRICVAEKHSATLESTVVKSAKNMERKLRESLIELGAQLSLKVLGRGDQRAIDMAEILTRYLNRAAQYLVDRRFAELLPCYKALLEKINQHYQDVALKEELLKLVNKQISTTQNLIQFVEFSGKSRVKKSSLNVDDDVEDYDEYDGAIQKFQKIFADYKNAIRDNTDAIYMQNTAGQKVLASDWILEQYRALVREYGDFFMDSCPELSEQLQYFGVQLHCFGMTYGVGHIRQDTSIFRRVWNAILLDLMSDLQCAQYSIIQWLAGRQYQGLDEAERMTLHQRLQDGGAESRALLDVIKHKHKNGYYAGETKDFSWVKSELDRLQLALYHQDMFENIIISNSESAANILEVESLLAVFPEELKASKLTIVPLLEKRQDLENYENILLDYIKTKIQQELEFVFDYKSPGDLQEFKDLLSIHSRADIKGWVESKNRREFCEFLSLNPALRAYLEKITIEIMVGFSDTERVSGMSALISVQKVQEDFIHLTRDFGVGSKIYYGPGGDINRGGSKRRDQKGTLQGNARSILNTPESVLWFRENQFYQAFLNLLDPERRMEIDHMPPEMQEWLHTCMKEGASFYEHLHDTQNGLGKLMGLMLGRSEHWMVSILNSSSRAAQRGIADNAGDRTASVQSKGARPESYIHPDKPRAITATQMKEMLRTYLNCIGPCYGIRKIGLERATWLYDHSETFRDMVEKECMAVSMRDFSVSAYALFEGCPDFIAQNDEQRKAWADECQNSYPDMLSMIKDIEKMSKNPESQYCILLMLSRLFAYIEVECQETQQFLLSLKKSMGPVKDGSLLSHQPLLEAQIEENLGEVEPLSYLLARQTHHVNNGVNLDEKYQGLNGHDAQHRRLTGIGSLLANVGAGITAFRQMAAAWVFAGRSQNMTRLGFERAKMAATVLGKEMHRPRGQGKPVLTFLEAAQKDVPQKTLQTIMDIWAEAF